MEETILFGQKKVCRLINARQPEKTAGAQTACEFNVRGPSISGSLEKEWTGPLRSLVRQTESSLDADL
ncbi:hypothetical protein CEXT_523381 [Caerostris extrusa]|uniref:Uncharacterized protein n=1 Tax=Caerostris extrusa TaxID=172846 RepID=A0AAV4Y6D8_CAEEX|nr:hypothetical protein CEXT_523381 [Caerostris extrusa]